MKNLTSKMVSLALALTCISNAQEANKQQETPKQELSWMEKYNQAIEKQTQERIKAFRNGTPDEHTLAQLIETQRNRIIQLEKERQKQ